MNIVSLYFLEFGWKVNISTFVLHGTLEKKITVVYVGFCVNLIAAGRSDDMSDSMLLSVNIGVA